MSAQLLLISTLIELLPIVDPVVACDGKSDTSVCFWRRHESDLPKRLVKKDCNQPNPNITSSLPVAHNRPAVGVHLKLPSSVFFNLTKT